MDITDQAVSAYRLGAGAALSTGETSADEIIRAGLAEVAPLIAAQALRRAAERVNERATELRADFRSGAYGIEYVNGMEDAVGVVERTVPYL